MKNILITSLITIGMMSNTVIAVADEVKTPDCNVAQDRLKCLTEQGSSETVIPEGTVSNLPMSGNTVNTINTANPGAAGSGVYTQAAEAKNQANNTMMLGLAMAAMFAMQCGPRNPTACMLAAAAAAAAMMAAGKKAEAQKLMNTLGNGGAGTTDTTSGTSDAVAEGDLAKVRDQLLKKGYKLNDDGSFTAPNGATVDAGMSDQSLANAGLDGTQTSSLRSQLDKLRKEMQDKLGTANANGSANGLGDTAMSGAYGSKGGSTSETGKGNPNAAERMALDRNPASWDGYFNQFGDSLIGVAQGDIFRMVEKRVDKERKGMGH